MSGEGGKPRQRGGVPTTYTVALGEAICERLAGGETLAAICAEAGMPAYGTVQKWQREIPGFGSRYREARERMTAARRAAGLPASPGGRRGIYCEALAEAICVRLAAGESLAAVCAETGMPAYGTVLHWLEQRPEFRARYARARVLQSHAIADELLATLRREDLAPADKQARIKGLTWMAARLAPVKYGEGEADEGGDEGPLVTIVQNGGWEGTGD